jgi:diketogulonate reductase-like aldo/keto reductase
MKTRRFGPLDVEVPVIGLGTWNMEADDQADAVAAMRRAVDVGATHLDTAELYGDGRVEEMVGLALDGLRDRVFLVSKVLPRNATRAGTVRACETSLRRLRTDHLDLYLLHWRDGERLDETIAAFEDLRAQGKIRAWGVSNFDAADLDEALALAGPGTIACNQVLYHLLERSIEHAVIPWCERHHVAVVAYSPFGSGDFPARGPGARTLASIAAAHRATPHQVALAFLTHRPSVFAIPKSSHVDRVTENAAAAELVLSADEIAEIDAAFPLGPWNGLPTL